MVWLEECEKADLAGKELHTGSHERLSAYKIRGDQILELLENQAGFVNSC